EQIFLLLVADPPLAFPAVVGASRAVAERSELPERGDEQQRRSRCKEISAHRIFLHGLVIVSENDRPGITAINCWEAGLNTQSWGLGLGRLVRFWVVAAVWEGLLVVSAKARRAGESLFDG